jgi:DNA mismatch repair ATPase MutS
MTNTEFKLPIEFLEKKEEVSEEILSDLELNEIKENQDISGCLYNYIFDCDTESGKSMVKKWNKYYTNDVMFLTDSQKLYSNMTEIETDIVEERSIIELVENINTVEKFEDKYFYIGEFYGSSLFNSNEKLILVYSIFLMLSPLMTLSLPLILLLGPFFMLKMQNQDINLKTYFEVLRILMKQIPLGKIFELNTTNIQSLFYPVFSIGMYIFQLYQNFRSCIQFKQNMYNTSETLCVVKSYLKRTIENMDLFLEKSNELKAYEPFNVEITNVKSEIEEYYNQLGVLSGSKYELLQKMGKIRCEFYKLYKEDNRYELLKYSYAFNGYMDNICSIKKKLTTKLGKAIYSKTTNIKGLYYPYIKGRGKTNDIKFDGNIILTGVNASGKTTLIKTVLMNILLSQQIGYGFYESCTLDVYDMLHSYLNIPDTSGRDSLFQAEARRCKVILDKVEENPNHRHFCIFDELYSGTNPREAAQAGYAYLKYLSETSNVDFILTTHYLDMCKKLNKLKSEKSIKIYHMLAIMEGEDIKYTYKIKKGITKMSGGVQVLKSLKYPEKIIQYSRDYSSDKK